MPDTSVRVLWADDEIDLLRPHILFLESKGYSVRAVPNGEDAVELVRKEPFDVVLLDEMMPGLGGLGTLQAIKELDPSLQVVMITKSEEESLMNEALGKRIADYLIKPVNPSQIWLALKRLTEGKQLVAGQFTRDYVREFQRLQIARMGPLEVSEWVDLYVRMTHLEKELFAIEDTGLKQTHMDTKKEMNSDFGRFIDDNYRDWCAGKERPMMSHDVIERTVAPHLRAGKRVYFILIDCMRLDQWLMIQPLLDPLYDIRTDFYMSILPTATPYSRNAIFAGLWPAEIAKKFPKYWQEASNEERSKNRYERELLEEQMKRLKLDGPVKYSKVYHVRSWRSCSTSSTSWPTAARSRPSSRSWPPTRPRSGASCTPGSPTRPSTTSCAASPNRTRSSSSPPTTARCSASARRSSTAIAKPRRISVTSTASISSPTRSRR
jgi:CheY-like chemotaxis protein